MSSRFAKNLIHSFITPCHPLPTTSTTPKFPSTPQIARRQIRYKSSTRSWQRIRSPIQMSQPFHQSSTNTAQPDTATSTQLPNVATSPTATSIESESDPTVQYVVVRRDLLSTWPTGSVIAQGIHASIAAVWASRDSAVTNAYCAEMASAQMHTVVLEAKNETALLKLADRLREGDVQFALWKEQPEDFVTALASWPYPRAQVKKHFSKFKLFK